MTLAPAAAKLCPSCKGWKALDSYYPKERTKRVGYRCKDCSRRMNRNTYARNQGHYVEKTKRFKRTNPALEKLIRKRHYLKKLYGITLEQFEQMVAEQAGRCACCKSTLIFIERKYAVDHDHVTGAVRGVLCSTCNIQLGWYERWPEFHIFAARYLRAQHV